MLGDQAPEASKALSPEGGGFSFKLLALLVITLLPFLWLLAGFGTLAWYAHQVPLAPQDLADASWLGSPTLALHFTTGVVGAVFCAAVVLMGIAMGFASVSPLPVMAAFIFAGAMSLMDEGAQVRIGILDDVVRIGCFVPNTRECNEMLGISQGNAISIHAKQDAFERTPEYAKSRKLQVTQSQEWLANLESLPGVIVLRAPMLMGRTQELKDRVFTQRAEVAQLRAEHARK